MLPNAQGDLDQLNILCSLEDKPLVETILNDYFNEIIYTPQPEKLIDIVPNLSPALIGAEIGFSY